MPEAAAPANVTPANPLGGAQTEADRFESFWQQGAFDSQNPKEAAQLQAERGPAEKPPEPAKQPEVAAQPEPAGEQPLETPEAPEYADLDEYLTKAGIERESFLTLPVAVKVDGQTVQAPLADLLRSYSQEKHFTQKSQALADERRTWDGEREQARQVLQQNLQTAQTLANLAQQQLLADFQGVDWNKLMAEDAGRWAALQTQYGQRYAAIQSHLAQAQQQQQALKEQADKEREARLPQEREAMLMREPTLRDPAKFEAAKTEIRAFADKMGLKPEEISQAVFDHRLLLTLHYASQYLKLQAAAPQALKRVQAAPKPVAAGARVTRDPKQAAAQAAKERWMRNPRDSDAQATYAETLIS